MFFKMPFGVYDLTKVVKYKRLEGTMKRFYGYQEPTPEKSSFFGLFTKPARKGYYYKMGIYDEIPVKKEQAFYGPCDIEIWFMGLKESERWLFSTPDYLEDLIKKIHEANKEVQNVS